MYLSLKHLSLFSLNPYKYFCIHYFFQQGIPGLCYPVPSLLLWTWFPLVSFTGLPRKDHLSLPSLSMSFTILHACHILPKSLPPSEIFCLRIVPHHFFYCFDCFDIFYPCCPLLKVFGFLLRDDFQAKGFSYIHPILIYLCSVRWIIDLNDGIVTCSVYPSFANSKCFLIFCTAIECWIVTLWNQLLGPPSLVMAIISGIKLGVIFLVNTALCLFLLGFTCHFIEQFCEVLQVSQSFLILTPLNALSIAGTLPCLTTNTAFKVNI